MSKRKVTDFFQKQQKKDEGSFVTEEVITLDEGETPSKKSKEPVETSESRPSCSSSSNGENIARADILCQPDQSFVFPKTVFGKQHRSCQSIWFQTFKWLDYDTKNDCVTCFICKRHLSKLGDKQVEAAFTIKGFRNWKKAKVTFNEHQKSNSHVAAMTYEVVVPQCGEIRAMTNANKRYCHLKICG